MPGIETRAPLRTETSSGLAAIAEAFAGTLLEFAHRRATLSAEPVGEAAADAVELETLLGRDDEPGRHRQPGARHLGETGALAPEQILLIPGAFFKEVDRLRLGGWGGRDENVGQGDLVSVAISGRQNGWALEFTPEPGALKTSSVAFPSRLPAFAWLV